MNHWSSKQTPHHFFLKVVCKNGGGRTFGNLWYMLYSRNAITILFGDNLLNFNFLFFYLS